MIKVNDNHDQLQHGGEPIKVLLQGDGASSATSWLILFLFGSHPLIHYQLSHDQKSNFYLQEIGLFGIHHTNVKFLQICKSSFITSCFMTLKSCCNSIHSAIMHILFITVSAYIYLSISYNNMQIETNVNSGIGKVRFTLNVINVNLIEFK